MTVCAPLTEILYTYLLVMFMTALVIKIADDRRGS